MRRPWLMFTGLALMAAMAGALAQPAETEATPEQMLAQIEASNTARLQLGRELAASGQPRKLYAAWLLAPMSLDLARGKTSYSPEADTWLMRAIHTGSEDPVIAAAAVTRCIRVDECNVEQARVTLATADAEDAGSQLLLMRLAEHRKDPIEAERAWQRVAKASRYRDPAATLIGVMDVATRDYPWPLADPAQAAEWERHNSGSYLEQERTVTLFGIAAMHFPADLKQASKACPGTISDAAKREPCRQLFNVMANSSSLLLADYGASRMAELEQGPAQAPWLARKRELQWITTEATAILGDETSKAAKVSPAEYARWLAEQGELPAMRRLLAVYGVPVAPPVDWQSVAAP
ncbi:hypothetical protein [Stenotrophomonas sp. PS02298]|uniref:hypothetical protein n=1 Tax=Stenotrophomonas sp. PS02298 TaxID=2991424 RepID=UPI00249C1154|nr:hypothetical protein [Stenotrophomonas sp. PS02298]